MASLIEVEKRLDDAFECWWRERVVPRLGEDSDGFVKRICKVAFIEGSQHGIKESRDQIVDVMGICSILNKRT